MENSAREIGEVPGEEDLSYVRNSQGTEIPGVTRRDNLLMMNHLVSQQEK